MECMRFCRQIVLKSFTLNFLLITCIIILEILLKQQQQMDSEQQHTVPIVGQVEVIKKNENQAKQVEEQQFAQITLKLSPRYVQTQQTQQKIKTELRESEEQHIKSDILQKSQENTKKQHQPINPPFMDQNDYIWSIQQIQRILSDKELNQEKFLKLVLQDFSPYVFSEKLEEEDFESYIVVDENIFDVEFLQKHQNNPQIQNMIHFNSIFHCRIVYILYCLTTTDAHMDKQLSLSFSKNLQQLKKHFLQLKLRYSFNEGLWTQKRDAEYSYSYRLKPFDENKKIEKEELELGDLIDSELFAKIEKFLIKLGFTNPKHQFNRKMTHLNKSSYKIQYIQELSFFPFKNSDQVFEYLSNHESDRFNNIKFYHNEQKASYNRLTLHQIHNLKGQDYGWLERTHDYIQWLFPNHFQSNFNGDSFALGYVEAEIFQGDKKILERLVQSFLIYLDFMGCKLYTLPQVGSTEKKLQIDFVNQKETISRLKECLVYNTHNHLRIMRILACLSVVGLRKYAQAFLQFLNGHKITSVIDSKRIESPLNSMWNLYLSDSKKQKAKALEMCFLPYDEFYEVKNCQDLIDPKKEKDFKSAIQRIKIR